MGGDDELAVVVAVVVFVVLPVMMMEDAPYEGSGAEEDRHGRRKPAAGLVLARWYLFGLSATPNNEFSSVLLK